MLAERLPAAGLPTAEAENLASLPLNWKGAQALCRAAGTATAFESTAAAATELAQAHYPLSFADDR